MHPDRLDLRAHGAAAGQAGDEGQLHGADDIVAVGGDDQQVSGIGVYGVERVRVGRERLVPNCALARAAQRAVGEKPHDGGQVLGRCPPLPEDGGGQRQGRQGRAHASSLRHPPARFPVTQPSLARPRDRTRRTRTQVIS